ncbi:MFS transporter [Symbiobacterium terraclitae]|uniref:MFS transporter n=1 Tax=Symbiobacterium terraclitae TaxID=557451 RepID=UPI0035B51C51
MLGAPVSREAAHGRVLIPALAISRLGNEFYYLATPLLVYDLSQSSTAMGIQYAAEYLPLTVLPLIGVVADRISRMKLLLTSDIVRIIMLLVTPLLLKQLGAGPGSLILMSLLGLLLTFWSQVFEVGLEASLPGVVGRENLGKVYSQLSAFGSGARLIGPALAGWLVSLIGPPNVLLLNALTYGATLVAVAHLWRAGVFRHPVSDASGTSTGFSLRQAAADAKEALEFIFVHPVLRSLSLVYFILMVGVQFGMTLLIFYYRDVIGLAAESVGLLMTVSGSAQLALASLGSWLQKVVGKGRLVIAGIACAGLGWIITGLIPAWWGLVVGCVLLSAPQAPVSATVNTMQQQATREELLGRVSATTRWLAWASLPIAALTAGAIAEAVGAQAMLIISGGVILVAALIGSLSPLLRVP